MKHSEIIAKFEEEALNGDQIFQLARSVAYFYQKPESDIGQSLDLIIRLIDRRRSFEERLPGIGSMIDAITREAGLYPDISERGSWRDELAIEIMKAPGLPGIIFHIEQAIVFNKLAKGRSIILSAPTSFGKSLLIDALIACKTPKTVVAVVPTIALLDEFRRRMEDRFPDYQVIIRGSEKRASEKAIFIGTQERLLEQKDFGDIDLFVIDEFYKLDLDRNDTRSLALNTILARYGKKARRIYFLGPSIDSVPNATTFRPDIEFVKTNYSPVTADIIDRSDFGPDVDQLISDILSVKGSSSLIYVQSPPAAYRLTNDLVNAKLRRKSDFCKELSIWLADNFHPEWLLVESVSRGIGIHHGRIPRSIAHLMFKLFNEGELGAIVCTSSMIEGINTAAENVFIFDRMISTKKLDRFTFDNIKGRAGRMFKHNIGRVFLYNNPPDQTNFDVCVPLFNLEEAMSPELLLKIEDEALPINAKKRKRAITDASSLPISLLSTWSEFGIDELNKLADVVKNELVHSPSLWNWTGIPTFEELEYTIGIPWNILNFQKHDIRTARQFAMFANRLRKSVSFRTYIDSFVTTTGIAAQSEIDRCFNFMRGAEYTFPQVLLALNDVIDAIFGTDTVNYRVYAVKLQNLFLPGELRSLDEFGVPLPLVARLSDHLTIDDITACRQELSHPGQKIRENLSTFEMDLLSRGLS